jgi:hypothetical protein
MPAVHTRQSVPTAHSSALSRAPSIPVILSGAQRSRKPALSEAEGDLRLFSLRHSARPWVPQVPLLGPGKARNSIHCRRPELSGVSQEGGAKPWDSTPHIYRVPKLLMITRICARPADKSIDAQLTKKQPESSRYFSQIPANMCDRCRNCSTWNNFRAGRGNAGAVR